MGDIFYYMDIIKNNTAFFYVILVF